MIIENWNNTMARTNVMNTQEGKIQFGIPINQTI